MEDFSRRFGALEAEISRLRSSAEKAERRAIADNQTMSARLIEIETRLAGHGPVRRHSFTERQSGSGRPAV